MSLPRFVARKLSILKFPDPSILSVKTPNFQKIVLWLEEEKIRLWNQTDRVKLRDVTSGAKWFKVAKEYLKELGLAEDRVDKLSERAPDSLKISILDTLTSMAVHDEYQDAVEEGKIALPMQVDENPSTNGGSFEGSFDRSATDLVGLIDPLNKVLSKNDIPLLTDDVTNDDICAAIGILEARICRGDKNGESDQRMGEGALDIAKLPIGIELSEDEQGLHMPVVILRLSHNYNMREFQSGINETINALQQYTADPKTDSALGRVGGR